MTYEFVWDGGRPCLDFVNTLRDRWAEGYELLREPRDLARWLRAAGLASAGTRLDVRPEDLLAATALRAAIDRVLGAAARGGRIPRTELAELNAAARHRPAPQLQAGKGGEFRLVAASSDEPVRAALGVLAVDAIELLADGSAAQVRVCGSDTCGLRFLDRSPARNRQWCSMARCGNREKARLHYARTKGRTEESSG